MAGLYVVFGEADEHRLNPVAAYMRLGGEEERRVSGDLSYVWLGHDSAARFAPAYDPATRVHCIVAGRLSWPSDAWEAATRLPYEGGTANRLMLDRYLRSGPGAVAPYNGAAAILIWDPRDRTVRLWTDQFGYQPAFVCQQQSAIPAVFTTFPDAALADPQLTVETDCVSMAEFLRAWRVTPPHTYYKDIKHAGAATYRTWNLATGASTSHEYWRPFEDGFFPSLEDAAAELATAVAAAVRERTAIAERPAMFISGGADSRVMLFGAADPRAIHGLNLYEHPTHESAIAESLCNRVGAKYVGLGRDGDYYPRMHAANVRWSGAMWSAEDNHYFGVADAVRSIGADVVMTACTTDWVFKGYGLEKTYRRLLGRNLPLKRFIHDRVDAFLPNYARPAPPELASEIDARMDDWFRGTPKKLSSDLDYLRVEDRRIRPTCYTVSVSGQIMYRTYPYDTFLADSRVANCYSKIRAEWKLNGQVWGLAAARICRGAADIVDANFGWSVDANVSSKLIAFARGWIKRRVTRPQQQSADHPPSTASWPDFGWYAKHSESLRELWTSTPESHRRALAWLWGSDPWAIPLRDWAAAPSDLMRLVTLLQHWRITGRTCDAVSAP